MGLICETGLLSNLRQKSAFHHEPLSFVDTGVHDPLLRWLACQFLEPLRETGPRHTCDFGEFINLGRSVQAVVYVFGDLIEPDRCFLCGLLSPSKVENFMDHATRERLGISLRPFLLSALFRQQYAQPFQVKAYW